jgi:hypothetical protein
VGKRNLIENFFNGLESLYLCHELVYKTDFALACFITGQESPFCLMGHIFDMNILEKMITEAFSLQSVKVRICLCFRYYSFHYISSSIIQLFLQICSCLEHCQVFQWNASKIIDISSMAVEVSEYTSDHTLFSISLVILLMIL